MRKGVVGQGLSEIPSQCPRTAAPRSSVPQPILFLPVPVPVPPPVVSPPHVPLAFETPQGVMQVEGKGGASKVVVPVHNGSISHSPSPSAFETPSGMQMVSRGDVQSSGSCARL